MSTLAVTALALLGTANAASYSLQQDWSGSSFFNGWGFQNMYDNTTNGDVVFANYTYASANQLAYVNSAGRAVVAVSKLNVPYNEKRLSVKMTSSFAYSIGSVFVLDAIHMPYGCSVWPAFWTIGTNWPANGEIDIIEGVNLQTRNQMALHTAVGSTCAVSASAAHTGTIGVTSCANSASSTAGCTVTDPSTNSYGAAFAQSGGGVFAAEFATTGINIWFFPRASVPSDLSSTSTSINPANWGTPSANYSSASCDIASLFGPQNVVLDTTLCGDYAGAPTVYNATCSGTCYLSNVINDGTTTYANAYWEMNYIRVFGSGTAPIAHTVDGSTSTNASSTSSSPAASTTKSSADRVAMMAAVFAPLMMALVAVQLLVL